MQRAERRRPQADWVRVPALVPGFGLGAFLDGIVLHTRSRSGTTWSSAFRSDGDPAGLESNTFWDGVFHLAS